MTGAWIRFSCSLIAILAFANGGCQRNQQPPRPEPVSSAEAPKQTEKEPPLLLDDEPPLLLEDSQPSDTANASGADNSRCFVCHANYRQEKIAVTHAKAGIGCPDCHGASDAHIADESWGSGGNGTPPDIMYRPNEINDACMTCHAKATIDTPQHAPVFAESAEKMVCTDCHGDHRLAKRRCKWK